jgi:glucose/mannose-6-phosphate isomerase
MTIEERIKKYDPEGMFGLLDRFVDSFDDALRRAEAFSPEIPDSPDGIVVCGMGGSALGAELVRGFCGPDLTVPLEIVRDYTVPAWVGPRTLVFAFSYSGGTEETLSAFKDAMEKKAQIVVATSGGKLGEVARELELPLFLIPEGIPPRLSIHYFMAAMMRVLTLCGLTDAAFLEGARSEIARAADEYALAKTDNLALQMAQKLQNRTVLLYGSGAADPVVRIWKSQFNENAKQFVHMGHMSELNHNEILTWPYLLKETNKPVALLVRSWQDNGQMQKRFDFSAEQLKGDGVEVIQLRSDSRERGAELFHLVMLGVWASFYLAVLCDRNPMDIDAINNLKAFLS